MKADVDPAPLRPRLHLDRQPVFPSDFRSLSQTLSRLAVATSCGLGTGCVETAQQGGRSLLAQLDAALGLQA